eukprot:6959127-Prymnesium_polylepis.1
MHTAIPLTGSVARCAQCARDTLPHDLSRDTLSHDLSRDILTHETLAPRLVTWLFPRHFVP